MAKISDISTTRDGSVLKVSFKLAFSAKERELNLMYWPTVVLYERDGSLDKVFFWNNHGRNWVHSIQRPGDEKDDYIGFFAGDSGLRPDGRSDVIINKQIDLDDPTLRDNVRRANDPEGEPPVISSRLWEEPVAFIHVHNELSPSTWTKEFRGLSIDFR